MKYVKEFATHADYTAYVATDYPKPNVSLCVAEGDVHYNPTPPPLCKLTLSNGEVVKLEGSGTLTSAMTKPYSATCVSAEIGGLCTTIGDWAFNSCSGLTSITIPDSVTRIGELVFYQCRSLSSITIPDSVTSIGAAAFYGCFSLSSITIPNGVTSIGQNTFSGCSAMTSCTIGSGITSIGGSAFERCYGLTSITSLATTAPTIQSNTFQNVKTGGTLYVPQGSSGYDVWMGTSAYYLGLYNWTKVKQ